MLWCLIGVVIGMSHTYDSENAYMANIAFDNRQSEILFEDKVCSNDAQGSNLISYHKIINSMAKKYQIEPSLVYAMIEVESSWKSKAVSQKGARGLMQLMPSTARQMNVKNPFNPAENIEGGIKYLRYLLNRFNGDLAVSLAAYNAGPQKVERFGGIPPIKETEQYVKKVILNHIDNYSYNDEVNSNILM
jgi:soluble lytic murein transglycosylase-like protein